MTEQRGGALVPVHLDNAQAEGALSAGTRRILERPNNARAIIRSHGVDPSNTHDNSLFVLVLADNSTSMGWKMDPESGIMVRATSSDPLSNAAIVVRCQNRTIDSLSRSANPERIYFSTQALNPLPPDFNPESTVIDPYHPLAIAVRLSNENFVVTGATPLYDRTIQVLGAAIVEAQLGDDEYKSPRTSTLIITDGFDEGSEQSVEDCARVVRQLLSSPTRRHIVAAIGIGPNKEGFTDTFRKMGILPQWIKTADATLEAIAEAVSGFTRAANQAASATQEEFLLLTDGGFNQKVPQ